jgi:hypothetical protein
VTAAAAVTASVTAAVTAAAATAQYLDLRYL